MTMPTTLPGREWKPSKPRLISAAGVVLGLLLAGTMALWASEHVMDVVLVKPPAPLSKPLVELARKIGPYVADQADQMLPPEVVDQLGTKDYLLRRYRDTRLKEGEVGQVVSVNLNFYETGSATPHVPEVCWAGGGSQRYSDGMMFVEKVPHKDGRTSDIRMRRLSFVPQARDPSQVALLTNPDVTRLINVAYVFQLNDGYVATSEEVSKHFWDPQAKYAYHTKIELTLTDVNGSPVACDAGQAEPVFAEFLRSALGAIEECLPDAKVLAGRGAGAVSGDSKQVER